MVQHEESARLYSGAVQQIARRGEPRIAALLPVSWEMVQPGLVAVAQWRLEENVPVGDDEIRFYGLVART